MTNPKQKLEKLKLHPAVRAYRREIARIAGMVTSPAKTAASRRNGSAPVRPGMRPRGRPPVEKFGKILPETVI